jgi:hypothetical protein
MTANELADLLDEILVGDFESLDHHHFTRQAATMLRNQQAEIAELRKFISLNENRRAEWYAYELDNEMKRYKKASEK